MARKIVRTGTTWLLFLAVATAVLVMAGWAHIATPAAGKVVAATTTTPALGGYDRVTPPPRPGARSESLQAGGLLSVGRTQGTPSREETLGLAAEAGGGGGWRLGDDVLAPTSAGNNPAWSTVRGRYWKNTASDPKLAGQWDEANLARMQSGRAPQRFNPDKGGMESMELSHEPIPFRNGGTSFVPRWPQDHAAVDPFRRPGY